jgi:Lrp/AsnC family leucine-responsive transcriptional regulator
MGPSIPQALRDARNVKLLKLLRAEPRMGIAELARRIDMSAPAVRERVQRLQRSGVITGFSMSVDPAALGLPVAAYVRVRPAARQLAKIAALAESLDQVTECHRITGEDCFLIKVHAATIPELEATLDKFLMFGQTVSSIVVTTPVPPRPLPIPR